MGAIQQNVNQAFSIAGFLFSQTDTAKNLQAKQALLKEYKAQSRLAEYIEHEVTTPNKNGKGRSYEKTPIEEMEEVLTAEKNRRATAEKLFKLEGHIDETMLEETGGSINYMQNLIKEKKKKEADEKADEKAAEEAAEATDKEAKISAAASNVIQSAIKDPFAIADEELQQAIKTKQELNRRKGGIML